MENHDVDKSQVNLYRVLEVVVRSVEFQATSSGSIIVWSELLVFRTLLPVVPY